LTARAWTEQVAAEQATVPRVRRLIMAALGSALALAACGGEDNGADANGGGSRLSAAQYRAQFTRLCQESGREAAQLGAVQGANASALADYFDKFAAVQTRRRSQFERLRPPTDLQDEHAQIAPLLAAQIASTKQAATSFRAGSDLVSTYETLKTSQNRALRRQNRLVEKLKVPQCRSDVDASGGAAQGSS